MSRYIDADALYKALEKIYYYEMDLVEMQDSSILITFRTVCRQIDSIPTANVVEIVRCKDCDSAECSGVMIYCLTHGCYMRDNDFCSYGERREDEPNKKM